MRTASSRQLRWALNGSRSITRKSTSDCRSPRPAPRTEENNLLRIDLGDDPAGHSINQFIGDAYHNDLAPTQRVRRLLWISIPDSRAPAIPGIPRRGELRGAGAARPCPQIIVAPGMSSRAKRSNLPGDVVETQNLASLPRRCIAPNRTFAKWTLGLYSSRKSVSRFPGRMDLTCALSTNCGLGRKNRFVIFPSQSRPNVHFAKVQS